MEARTLMELKAAIEAMIQVHGETARWWGWDDGSLIIQGKKNDDKIDSCYYEDRVGQ